MAKRQVQRTHHQNHCDQYLAEEEEVEVEGQPKNHPPTLFLRMMQHRLMKQQIKEF